MSVLLDMAQDWPDPGVVCCYGAASRGPSGCTCWEPEYDVEQASPTAGSDGCARAELCIDCAYRPGSPEKSGSDLVRGDAEFLESIAAKGERFWCHQGMRRVLRWRHPSGMVHVPDGAEHQYDPPVEGGVPRKASGEPADLCAGWWATRKAFLLTKGEP